MTEQEHLRNTVVITEINKFRRECDIQKEEVKCLRQYSADDGRKCEEKKQEMGKLQSDWKN